MIARQYKTSDMHRNQVEEDLLSNEDKPTYLDILAEYLLKSEKLITNHERYQVENNKKVLDRINKNIKRRQDKVYLKFTDTNTSLFNSQWKYMQELFPKFKPEIKKFMKNRFNIVYGELLDNRLVIEIKDTIPKYSYEQDTKNQHLELLKGQSDLIKKKLIDINNTLDIIDGTMEEEQTKDIYANLYTQEKRKQYQSYMKKKQQERQERHRLLELQRKRQIEQERKHEQQKKKKEEEEFKTKKQQFMKKQMQLHQKRNQEKKIRELRNSEYIRVKKTLKEKPPLHEKFVSDYHKRHEYYQMERRHKILSQNKERYRHIDEMKIEEHQRKYESLRKQKEQERIRKMEEIMEEQKKEAKHHSSMQLPKQTDKELLQKQQARQKYKKMKEYQDVVKQNFKPKINEEKRKQMLTLIEELELNSKKLKKTKLDNGSVIYEDISGFNSREIGMKYLQKTKEMAIKAKMNKSATSKDNQTFLGSQKKKPIDYLAQWRKNPTSKKQKDFIEVMLSGNSKLSYDEKMKKIKSESEKLSEMNKQKEMQLKYGKFSTSDDILTCTEEIDQNYLDIAKMKLLMIKQDQ